MNKTNVLISRENLEVVMTRIFDAPLELVWRAFTDSKLIPKWWGPKKYTTVIEKNDLIPSGYWRFVSRDAEGNEEAFYGTYEDIEVTEHITWTFNYEPIGPGHEIIETIRFETLDDGKTKVKSTSFYKNIEDLEGMIAGGMEEGASESYDRLDELLEEEKKERKIA